MKAVRFDRFGGAEVLEVVDVPTPEPEAGEVLVAVKAASLNPGEIAIREGLLEARWPTTFPCGEGTDLAGVASALGEGVSEFAVGDAVCGWTDRRASHAEFAVVPAEQLTAKPENVSFEVAGSIAVAPMAAYASVRAVAPKPGEVVVIAGAAGGVGVVAVQLAVRTGASVIALASERNHAWLEEHGAIAVSHGEGQAERIRAAAPGGQLDAFIDLFGRGYVDLAIELGIAPERINTIADREAIGRLGVHGDGTGTAATRAVLRELAGLLADGSLEIPIAGSYPLAQVREAYADLAQRKTRGKIVLIP
jgi:NADPH:quinone reductase-like Zn-dependent oxidoreductase